MKFGLYSSIASPPRGEHLDRCIDEVIAEAQLAEACGFDSSSDTWGTAGAASISRLHPTALRLRVAIVP
jgi:hypothetical protein